MSHRIAQINDLIRDHLSRLIKKELFLEPNLFISITRVDTSPDLRYARVFVSVFPEPRRQYALKTLQKEIFRLQGALNRLLACKPLPRISFVSDETEKKADQLEELFAQIEREKRG